MAGLFDDEGVQRRALGRGAWVELWPGFVRDDGLRLARLVESLPLKQETLHIFGRRRLTPRLTSWHGDEHASYGYSGRVFAPSPWTPELSELRDMLVRRTGYQFNSVLANYYRDGSDSMGAHSDDEPELGPEPDDVAIASLSLGARRRFRLTPRGDGEAVTYRLGEGDLLLMGGTTQTHFTHAVPKTRRPTAPRLNLTFRVVTAQRLPSTSDHS